MIELGDESRKGRQCQRTSKHRERISERTYVDHTYHDHLNDPVDLPSAISLSNVNSKNKKGPRGGVTVSFPEKLHDMLCTVVQEGLEDIVSWQPHGRCFLVRKKNEFVNEVMSRFFSQSKLTSFQRQLNLYGFIRLTAGSDRGAYYHELFLRGRPDLCRRMIRTRVKGNGMKAASSPATEPDFYAMEPCLEGDSTGQELRDPSSINLVHCSAPSVSDGTSSYASSCVDEGAAGHEVIPSESFSDSCHRLISSSGNKSAIVSAPSSPRETKPVTHHNSLRNPEFSSLSSTFSVSEHDPMVTSYFDLDESVECCDVSVLESLIPQNGDEVFFEGLKFRYLDRLEMDLFTLDMSQTMASTWTYTSV